MALRTALATGISAALMSGGLILGTASPASAHYGCGYYGYCGGYGYYPPYTYYPRYPYYPTYSYYPTYPYYPPYPNYGYGWWRHPYHHHDWDDYGYWPYYPCAWGHC